MTFSKSWSEPRRSGVGGWSEDRAAPPPSRLSAQAAEQRARAARESDPLMREAAEAGADMVSGWADDEERAARRWQEQR